jgi:hypothetical protein
MAMVEKELKIDEASEGFGRFGQLGVKESEARWMIGKRMEGGSR